MTANKQLIRRFIDRLRQPFIGHAAHYNALGRTQAVDIFDESVREALADVVDYEIDGEASHDD